MVLRKCLDEKVFFWQVAIVLACFQSEKSKTKLDLMRSFLRKRFTKLVKIKIRGRKAKISHLSHFQFSFCTESVPKHYSTSCKTFCIKTFKKSIKNCQGSMPSWRNYQFRFKTGSWCIAEFYLRKNDDNILHNKIVPIKIKLIGWF